MAEMKPTPGPWSVNTSRHYENGKPAIVWGPEGPGHGDVCQLPPIYPREFNEANARLIAAAPDMLAALQMFVDQHTLSSGEYEAKYYMRHGPGEPLALARMALAKAKGETNG